MPFSTLASTLHTARTAWLEGDAEAWARYTECCLQLGVEHRDAPRAKHPSQDGIPPAGHRPSAPTPQPVRQ
ncbi:MAG: hypothetical protein AAGI91_01690 [Bacteroidota bacterium]